MKLSIVIISHDSRERLERCLASLQEVLLRNDVELVWVDNGSRDGAEATVHAMAPKALCIRLEQNKGVAYARNRGIEATNGKYVLLLDDDTEALTTAIDTMTEYMDTHGRCGLCAVALRAADGTLQESFKEYPGVLVKLRNVLREKMGRGEQSVELPKEVLHPCYVIGACQMFRRSIYEEVGPLDEAIFYGPEDADFCIRVRGAGFDVAYLPQASITHHWQRATRRKLFSRLSRLHAMALLHFYIRHRRI